MDELVISAVIMKPAVLGRDKYTAAEVIVLVLAS